MNTTTTSVTGGCLCGAVRYALSGPLREVTFSHCGQCRRSHGHFAAYTGVDRGGFALTEDRGLKWYRSSDTARRGFCAECGASLFWDGTDRPHMSVAAGSLDDSTGLKASRHIFVADKPAYYRIADGLAQH